MHLSVSKRDDTGGCSGIFDADSESTREGFAQGAMGLKPGAVPTIHVTRRDGSEQTLEAHAPQSLKDALKGAGVEEILGLCGGFASCGTCHVHVADAWLDRLPPIKPDEEELLSYSDWREPNSRLACQIPFTEALDGISVTVAPED